VIDITAKKPDPTGPLSSHRTLIVMLVSLPCAPHAAQQEEHQRTRLAPLLNEIMQALFFIVCSFTAVVDVVARQVVLKILLIS